MLISVKLEQKQKIPPLYEDRPLGRVTLVRLEHP